MYGKYGTYVLLVWYADIFCCGISDNHAKWGMLWSSVPSCLSVRSKQVPISRHTTPYHILYQTRHTIPYPMLCLTSRDAISGHKSVSVDRDTRTEARRDTGLCNTCDTVTHSGHLLPMLTSRQICRALGSRINKNLSSARISDQQKFVERADRGSTRWLSRFYCYAGPVQTQRDLNV